MLADSQKQYSKRTNNDSANKTSDKPNDHTIETIFIGGGTPSVLPKGAIRTIMLAVYDVFDVRNDAEITVECNPGTIGREKLEEYHACGINRLSIGAQTFDDGLLRLIGRPHNARQISSAVRLAQQVGFGNINLDLMYGLPGQTVNQYENSLNTAMSLRVQHISAYSLILEQGTMLYSQIENDCLVLPDTETEYQMHALSRDILKARGFEQYEVSNFCRPERQCRHNLVYWQCRNYLAAGLGATDAVARNKEIIRTQNVSDLTQYFALIEAGRLPIESRETVDKRNQMFEYIMMGLRLIEGISLEKFKLRFEQDLLLVFAEAINVNCEKGLLELSGDALRLTRRGLDIQNTVLLDFMVE